MTTEEFNSLIRRVLIKCDKPEQKQMAGKFFSRFDYRIRFMSDDLSSSYVGVTGDGSVSAYAGRNNNRPLVPFNELANFLINPESYINNEIIIKLNDKFSAVLTKDLIQVGCQKFYWSILKDIEIGRAELGNEVSFVDLFKNGLFIKVETQEEKVAAVKFLMRLGFQCSSADILTGIRPEEFPLVGISGREVNGFMESSERKFIEFKNLADFVLNPLAYVPKRIKVKNCGILFVTDKGVEVDHAEFQGVIPWEKIEEIKAAREKLKDNSHPVPGCDE